MKVTNKIKLRKSDKEKLIIKITRPELKIR